MSDRPCTWQDKAGALCGAPAVAEHLGQPLCAAHERQFLGASIAAQVRAGIPPAVEADTVVDAGEPEPVGVARHRTRGGRGAVARLREET